MVLKQKNYCYLASFNRNWQNHYKSTVGRGKGGGGELNDPDSRSKSLYENLLHHFFLKDKRFEKLTGYRIIQSEVKGKGTKNSPYTLLLTIEIDNKKKVFRLSSDYLGPSRHHWIGLSPENAKQITNFHKVTRRLGGHIMWPLVGERGKQSINQHKGIIFKERTDLLLYSLNQWYLGNLEPESARIFNESNNQEWLLLFKDMSTFIKFWHLQPYLIDDSTQSNSDYGEFRDLTRKSTRLTAVPKRKLPDNRENYWEYAKTCSTIIRKRNDLIFGRR
jgi:hypothetical protein